MGDAKAFMLRKQALVLDDERRCDALGALLASRVMVKPHQVGVVQRVLSARRPRFVLADEVGLGKTIEAGMVFSALRLSGLARRVLVVAPSHLTVQWLVELFHKFNQLFTLMDSDRYAQSLKEQPEVSPWARFPLVVTSLEMLSRTEEHRRGGGRGGRVLGPGHHRRGAPPQGREGLRGRRGAGGQQLGPAAAHRHAHAAGSRPSTTGCSPSSTRPPRPR